MNLNMTFPDPDIGHESHARDPLSNKSNFNFAQPPTRGDRTSRWDHKDSSESSPSFHSSIPDAAWVSTSDLAKSPVFTLPSRLRPSTPTPLPDIEREDSFDSALSHLESTTPFLYGHGTELTSILEQRSIATMRTSSLSASDLSSMVLGKPGPNVNPCVVPPIPPGDVPSHAYQVNPGTRRLRRRQSFSLDDISPIPLRCRATCLPLKKRLEECSETSESPFTPKVTTADVRAYPQLPEFPPHQDPKTPPEVRKWAADYRRHHQRASGARGGRGNPTTTLDRIDIMFRGSRSSGHGDMTTHPYVRGQGWLAPPAPAPGASSSRQPHGSMSASNSAGWLRGEGSRDSTASSLQTPSRGFGRAASFGGVTRSSSLTTGPGGPSAASHMGKRRRSSLATRSSTIDAGDDTMGETETMSRPAPITYDAILNSAAAAPAVTTGNNVPLCRSCNRDAFEHWSLMASLTGRGEGKRNGADWCTRCAFRKAYWGCCMGEDY